MKNYKTMKKITFVFYLSLVPAFVSAQSKADSVCSANIEKIFNVMDLKFKYETAVYFEEFIENKNSEIIVRLTEDQYARYFEEITGVQLDTGKYKGGRSVEIKAEDFAKKLNYSSSQALRAYTDFIKNIKSDKEICLKCIDVELAKGDSSEYANKIIAPYNYRPPKWASLLGTPSHLTKSDYLKMFKEFIFNDNEEILPHGLKVVAYLQCGCKIPVYDTALNYEQ